MADNDSTWQYKPDGKSPNTDSTYSSDRSKPTQRPNKSSESVAWSASEYIEHQRGAGWYFALAAATLAISAGLYFLKDKFAAASVIIVGVIVAFFVQRKPQQIPYELSGRGVQIGEKFYSYNQFKSFSIIRDGPLSNVSFLPLKRFMPPISAYFDPKDEQQIVEIVGDHLPYEDRNPDRMDVISRRLRL